MSLIIKMQNGSSDAYLFIKMAITVCMLCFDSPARPWQALANCSSRRANSSAQSSRCAIHGQSFQDVQNFKNKLPLGSQDFKL